MASVITDTGITGLLYRNIQYGSCPVYIPLQLQCTDDFLDSHSLFKIGLMYVMARLRKGWYLTVARIQNIPREIMGAALKWKFAWGFRTERVRKGQVQQKGLSL